MTNPVVIRADALEGDVSPLDAIKMMFASEVPALVITGAGISAESGVPTFRGDGEHWWNKHFSELASPQAFADDPSEIWEWYCYRRKIIAACKPNAAHRALATWAATRPDTMLITQNVDGLHERACHPDVIRLHGSIWKNQCTALWA